MSIEWMNWAFKQELESPAKFVLVVLGNYADEEGWCYPSVGRMIAMTGLSDRTVRRHLDALEEGGFIVRERQHGENRNLRGYHYWLKRDRSEVPVSSEGKPVRVTALDRSGSPTGPVAVTGQNLKRTQGEPSTPQTPQTDSVDDAPNGVEGDGFEEFWEVYPRKVGKQAAQRAWSKLSDEQRAVIFEILPAHVEAWKRAKKEIRFIPHPSTWINQGRWDDEDIDQGSPDGERAKPYFIDRDGKPTSRYHR